VHDKPISYNELVEYARTHPSLNPLLSYGDAEGKTIVELEDKGVNCNKMKNPINEVKGASFCIS
jgi:hypothetical protein